MNQSPARTSRLELSVRFCETDLMGIVHHRNYLDYFEAGRVDWMKQRGVSIGALIERDVHSAVVEATVRYRKAAAFDDRLAIETTCAEATFTTVRFSYRVLRGEELLCEGETRHVCLGKNHAPRIFPKDLARLFRG